MTQLFPLKALGTSPAPSVITPSNIAFGIVVEDLRPAYRYLKKFAWQHSSALLHWFLGETP